jgi:hypothetical protein
MHIHPVAIGLHTINTSTAGNDRAAAAQRAAETRKRLLKSAQSLDEETPTDADATLLIGQWLDTRHSQTLPAGENDAAARGKDPDFG